MAATKHNGIVNPNAKVTNRTNVFISTRMPRKKPRAMVQINPTIRLKLKSGKSDHAKESDDQATNATIQG